MHGIRHVSLKSSEMQELQAIMAKGNIPLKECAEMMDMSTGEFRGKLFNNRLDTSKLSPEQLQKLEEAKPLIMDIRNKCEYKILNGFARMVYKQAKAAASNSNDPRNAFLEFEQVATLAVLDCIYGYSDTAIQFITYVWRSVRRRINHASNRLNPFCPLTNEALVLIQSFDEMKAEMNYHTTVDEVIEAMNLNEKQKGTLYAATVKMINQDQGTNANDDAIDYTAMRQGIDDVQEVSVIRSEARQAIKNADLSDIELQLLLAEMYPYSGWREDIASKFVNPRTGKRYSREVTGILDRAKEKVKKAYKSPPATPKENPFIDKIFDELSGKIAV